MNIYVSVKSYNHISKYAINSQCNKDFLFNSSCDDYDHYDDVSSCLSWLPSTCWCC